MFHYTKKFVLQEINICDDPNHLCTNREEGDERGRMFSFCGEACTWLVHSTHISSEREKGLKPQTRGLSCAESKSGIETCQRASVLGVQEDQAPSPDPDLTQMRSASSAVGLAGWQLHRFGVILDKTASCWKEFMEVYHQVRKRSSQLDKEFKKQEEILLPSRQELLQATPCGQFSKPQLSGPLPLRHRHYYNEPSAAPMFLPSLPQFQGGRN